MGERRGTKALELWCRRMTEGYPGVKIDNMTTSWRDGLAFCAMIHHFRPDLIDFASLNKTDVYANNELAFRTAERHLGIPALLDAEDMAMYPVPDRLSILTYLSQFYQAFGGSQGNSPTRIIPKRPANVSDRGIVSPTTTSPPKKVVVQTAGGGLVGVSRREPCTKCNLPVFLAERLHIDKKLFHRTCFRCARCSHQLNLANYYETEDGQYCCETCPDEDTSLYATPDKSPPSMKIAHDESASKLLSRSLSDEQKEKGLKKFGENNGDDEYSSIFENILEDSKDEKSYILNSRARNSFMSSQLLLDEDEKTDAPPELPKTSPPYIHDSITSRHASNESFRSEHLRVSDENKLDDPPPELPSSKPPDIEEPGSKTYLATVLNLRPTYESVTISEENVDAEPNTRANDGADRRPVDNDSVVSEGRVSAAAADDTVNKCSDSSNNRPLTVGDVSPTAFSFRNDRNKIVTKDTNTVSADAKPTTESPDPSVSIVRMRMRMFESDDDVKREAETIASSDGVSSSADSAERTRSKYSVDAVSKSTTETPTKVPSLDTNRSTNSNESSTTIRRSECDVRTADRSESNTLLMSNLDDSLINRDEEIADRPLITNDKCSSLNVTLPNIEDTSDAIDDGFPLIDDITDGERNEIDSTRPRDENTEIDIDHADTSLDGNVRVYEPQSESKHETSLAAIAASIDYPDDLNPFDDDEEESNAEENVKVTGLDDSTAFQIDDMEVSVPIPRARKSLEQTQELRKSTNPFDSSDEENEEVSKYCSASEKTNRNVSVDHPQPSIRTGSNTLGVKSVTGAPKINLNPFWSDGEEPSDGEHESATPVPKPRASKTSAISTTPEPSPRPRKLLDKSGVRYDSSTSLSSVNSSVTHTPSGTTRKKKPAPPPPPVKELFPLDPVSGQSSQASSPCASVPHTPKLRKRPAPKPPASISISTTISTTENTTTEPINIENGSCNADVSIPAKSPTKSNCSNEWEKEKISKDEVNRTRQSMTASTVSTTSPISDSDGSSSLSVPNKSTYGKWKRKKGPAPARPVPQRRQIKALPVVELRRELEFIEIQQQGLEKQGVKLEQIIREKCEGPADDESTMPPEVEDLVLQLFELVNEKNELFRKQAELMYLRRQQRLEEEHADIEYQIRCLMNQPERNKTDSDKEREEELINRLVEVVERRNEIVECLEMDRIREAEEDLSINTQLSLLAAKREEEPLVVSEETPIKLSKKEKKKIKKEKKFKGKDGRNIDADKDVDETESTLASISIKEKKKKKWFNV